MHPGRPSWIGPGGIITFRQWLHMDGLKSESPELTGDLSYYSQAGASRVYDRMHAPTQMHLTKVQSMVLESPR